MSGPRNIREAIQHLAGTHENNPVLVQDAEVVAVDIDSRTCTVQVVDGQQAVTRDDVRLMSSVDDGFLILPTVGSTVTILLSIFTAPVIVSYSGFDKMVLNGGELGGLVMLIPLVAKINALEKMLVDLANKYNVHIHPVSGDVTGPTTSQETQTIAPLTQRSDLENTSITHGL